ncbi:OmpH family outer membrane protein [Dinghuibacter silviterrae]|uniref:Periplasmic chaperone for outer membrane proteins Skp n=1 Tax=Dinghuibacter silviterrae TaxID=1539049 RepID=A0A4R8DEA8_9BACT|nr:OmpH family outer membrane protein [Dinghuibacter silviterrae]TDW95873.1 periplasmic chaperone for outer membrane proteins Skp [Dinghuibacter silviterrae]
MKNLSLVLNAVLLVAVGVLFYWHFKGTGSGAGQQVTFEPSSKDTSLLARPLKVAYVDLDSIEEKFAYFKQKQNDFDRKREAADRDLNAAANEWERKRMQMAQKGAALTQADVEAFQKEYTAGMQDLQRQHDVKQQEFAAEQQKIMEDIQGKIKSFLDDYNKSKRYSFIFTTGKGALNLFYEDTTYNITDEVLAGLNATIQVPKDK